MSAQQDDKCREAFEHSYFADAPYGVRERHECGEYIDRHTQIAWTHFRYGWMAAMREETGTLAEIAERHNVDLSYVSKLRLGQVRREYSNPFAGLALMGGSRG